MVAEPVPVDVTEQLLGGRPPRRQSGQPPLQHGWYLELAPLPRLQPADEVVLDPQYPAPVVEVPHDEPGDLRGPAPCEEGQCRCSRRRRFLREGRPQKLPGIVDAELRLASAPLPRHHEPERRVEREHPLIHPVPGEPARGVQLPDEGVHLHLGVAQLEQAPHLRPGEARHRHVPIRQAQEPAQAPLHELERRGLARHTALPRAVPEVGHVEPHGLPDPDPDLRPLGLGFVGKGLFPCRKADHRSRAICCNLVESPLLSVLVWSMDSISAHCGPFRAP